LLGFVGCVLDRQGLGPGDPPSLPPFTQYSSLTIGQLPVSYWPLGEQVPVPQGTGPTGIQGMDGTTMDGATTTHHFDGEYWRLDFPDDPVSQSAAAPAKLNLGQGGIVLGDTKPPHTNPNDLTKCIFVDGGFVKVPFHSELNPSSAFSLEAWVRPGWTGPDPQATRVVIASLDTTGGGNQGFALYAIYKPDKDIYIWQGFVGAGANPPVTIDGPELQFDEANQGTTHHLVLTFEAGALNLFVNGKASSPQMAGYQPSTSSDLLIGCGAPQLPEPRFPWVGNIQCVAVYDFALQPIDVTAHFRNGIGSLT
jgi:concanavalin A-like lectin/glucanase superfamily protein